MKMASGSSDKSSKFIRKNSMNPMFCKDRFRSINPITSMQARHDMHYKRMRGDGRRNLTGT